ncbi:hypothetical protein AAE478_000917 [Parahypoxylon ruwenzoriense]
MSKNQDFELLKPVTTSPQRPQRPRHQVRRSITELSSPIKLPRYHHLHHLRKDRDHDDHAPSPTNPTFHLPRGSLELPRSESATPYANSESGLRTSMLNPAPEDTPRGVAPITPQPPVNEEELLREQKEKIESRIACLRKSLAELNTSSTTTMRCLDDTYYSVLEKLSMLQSTIVALKELAGMSQGLNQSFKEESQGLVSELEQQAGSFGQFDDQQKRIKELRGRIYAGRDKVEALSKRVHVVRERIEGWERADREWQERTRKHLKTLWIIMSVLIFSLVILFVGVQYGPSSEDISTLANLASSNKVGGPDGNGMARNGNENVASMVNEVRGVLNSSRREDETIDNDVLRVLDEL